MRIDILTAVPELLEGFFDKSIIGRAQQKGLAEVHVHNLRDYTTDKHKRIDDYPFGGFSGMVMQCQPIDACISVLKAQRDYDEVIFVTPDGQQFDQPMANELSLKGNIISSDVCSSDLANWWQHAWPTPSSESSLEPSVTNRAHCPIHSRTNCWQHPSIPALPTTRGGKFPKYSCLAIRQKLPSGTCSNHSNAHDDFVPTS